MGQPSQDPILSGVPRCGHRSIPIKGLLTVGEVTDGQIDQGVGRSTVPALDRLQPIWAAAWRDERQIGDPAKIQ